MQGRHCGCRAPRVETEDLVQQQRVTAFQVVRAVLRQAGRAGLAFLHRLYRRIVGWRSPAAGTLAPPEAWTPHMPGWLGLACMIKPALQARAGPEQPRAVPRNGGCPLLHCCPRRWLCGCSGLIHLYGADAVVGRLSSSGLMVMDMGSHMLPGITGSHLVIQVLVPGLEERAREFPALSTMILKTGAARAEPPRCDSGA